MKKTLQDFNFEGKRVLLRVDYNVPVDEDGNILDDKRIRETLSTINYLLDNNAKVIVITHLGRPEGKIVESLRLDKIAKRLSELLSCTVSKLNEAVGSEVEKFVFSMKEKDVVMLENIRFYKEEKKDSEDFAKKLASLGDIYISDAFATAHRTDTSIIGIPSLLPSGMGFLLQKEVETLSKLLENPERPFIAIMGGAKVSDKLPLIKNLFGRVDTFLLGGGMAFTFMKAKGYEVGFSLVEENFIQEAKNILESAAKLGIKIILPVDNVIVPDLAEPEKRKVVDREEFPKDWLGADIGLKTIKAFEEYILQAKTIIWNGPLGVIEIKELAEGTKAVAEIIGRSNATSVVGGGETIMIIEQLGLENKFTHLSTGGGAFLEFMQGKVLPGVDVLQDK